MSFFGLLVCGRCPCAAAPALLLQSSLPFCLFSCAAAGRFSAVFPCACPYVFAALCFGTISARFCRGFRPARMVGRSPSDAPEKGRFVRLVRLPCARSLLLMCCTCPLPLRCCSASYSMFFLRRCPCANYRRLSAALPAPAVRPPFRRFFLRLPAADFFACLCPRGSGRAHFSLAHTPFPTCAFLLPYARSFSLSRIPPPTCALLFPRTHIPLPSFSAEFPQFFPRPPCRLFAISLLSCFPSHLAEGGKVRASGNPP